MCWTPSPCSCPDILERVVALHRHAPRTRAPASDRLPCGLPEDRRLGDEQRLIQILHNLSGRCAEVHRDRTVRWIATKATAPG